MKDVATLYARPSPLAWRKMYVETLFLQCRERTHARAAHSLARAQARAAGAVQACTHTYVQRTYFIYIAHTALLHALQALHVLHVSLISYASGRPHISYVSHYHMSVHVLITLIGTFMTTKKQNHINAPSQQTCTRRTCASCRPLVRK
jgi:hypothetical protein